MAVEPTTTPSAAWNHLVVERDNLIHNLQTSLDRNDRRNLDQRLAQIEDQLLGLAAPDLEGVITKLELIWTEQLNGEDEESNQKLRVLADLVRLSDD